MTFKKQPFHNMKITINVWFVHWDDPPCDFRPTLTLETFFPTRAHTAQENITDII